MRFHYDKKEDAFSIRFQDRQYAESDEVADGIIFDYDNRGKIIGMEILGASRKLPASFAASLRQRSIPVIHPAKKART